MHGKKLQIGVCTGCAVCVEQCTYDASGVDGVLYGIDSWTLAVEMKPNAMRRLSGKCV